MNSFVEVLITSGVSVGFVVGTWWSRNRRGGIADLAQQRDTALIEAQNLRRQLRAATRGHPSTAAVAPVRLVPLQLVTTGDGA